MDREWHIHRQLELLSSPTTVQFHRIDTYSSVVEGVRRVRRILTGDSEAGLFNKDFTREKISN
jgi:hypothetical protein